MLNPLRFFSKPEYLFRPRQVIRRLRRIGKARPELIDVTLPWGSVVTVHTGENVGADIYYYGIFDPIVPEAIWRLLDSGETALDVGANIGQNTSLMAVRATGVGYVVAFEPHPTTFQELHRNVAAWSKNCLAPIHLENLALGLKDGEASLSATTYLSSATLNQKGNGIKVPVRRLDSFLTDKKAVGVCKIDVEGHELDVLQGAEETLRRRGIRDIIFEDFGEKPSAVTQFLQKHGFTIFELHGTWLKPRLVPLREGNSSASGFMFNYLATLDSARASFRFRIPGWRCLLCF